MTLRVETVLVLDFGAQYTQLIARRVREAHVRSVVLPFSAKREEVEREAPVGIILSGGPSSVYDTGAPLGDPGVLAMRVPVLGLCYGMPGAPPPCGWVLAGSCGSGGTWP